MNLHFKMIDKNEPLLYYFSRIAIKLQNNFYNKLFGNPPIAWDPSSCNLKSVETNHLKIGSLLWIFQIFFGLFLFGVVFSVWCFLYAEGASLVAYFVFGIVLSLTIFQVGIGYKLCYNGEDNIFGMNALLTNQCNLIKACRRDWKLFEEKWRNELLILGLGLVNGTTTTISTISLAALGIIFEFDLAFFVFGGYKIYDYDQMTQNIIMIGRIVTGFCFALCSSRLMCFLFTYFFLLCQAYLGTWTLLSEFANFRKIFREYIKLAVIHTRIRPFGNRLVAFFMFLGHTLGTALCWVGIRGWDYAPHFIVVMFALFGLVFMTWVLIVICLISYIHIKGERVIKALSRNVLAERKIRRVEWRMCIRAMKPSSFGSGEWFTITRDAPGNYWMSAVDNLTTAVLTF